MLTSIPASLAEPGIRSAPLDRELLERAFRVMQTSRRVDDREIVLKRQNRIYL